MHRRIVTQREEGDDKSPMLPTNTQTIPAPYTSPDVNIAYFRTITTFANEAIQSAATTYTGFQGAMKDILPKLSETEQSECYNTFSEYHEMLMTTQRFVTRTRIRIQRARQTSELLASVDLPSIRALCVQIRSLLNRFRKIQAVIDAKIKDERTLQTCRNVFLGLLALAGAVCLIATGVGVGVGFTAGVKGTIAISGAVAAVAGTGALGTHVAQKVSTFELIMKNLRDTEELLGELSQNYAKVEAMSDLLVENDSSKAEFMKLLDELQVQVDKGFSLLTKI